MGSSSGESKSTTTQNLTPEQQSLVSLAMPQYQQFAASNPTLPGAAGVAGFNPNQVAGQNAVLGSTGTMGDIVGTAGNQVKDISGGSLLDVGNNPVVQNAVKATTDPIFQNLAEKTLPQLQATGAAGSGVNYGGSREGVAEGQAVQGAQRAAEGAAANVVAPAYTSGLNATMQALGLAPTTAAAQALPGATTSSVGDVQQQQAQNVLNAQNQAKQFADWLPMLKAQLLTQGAGALPGGSASSVGQTTQEAAPWQIAAGLLTGAGSLFGSGGLFNSPFK